MAAETPPNHNRFALVVLLALVPVGLGAGWLLGRMQGPPPAPPKAAVAPASPATPPSAPEVARPADHAVVVAAPEERREERPKEPQPEVLSAWTGFQPALEQSRANGKPILIDFNAEWCGPCQRLKQSVFDDGTRGHAVQAAVIPVSIVDRTREEGRNPAETETLQARYGVNAFPTLVVFSPATGRTESQRGFGDPDQMLQWIQWAANAVK